MKPDRISRRGVTLVYRHDAVVRVTHWLGAASIAVLLLSGLQILCAHPALYWGEVSRFDHPFVAIETRTGVDGEPRGALRLDGLSLDTTGLLGAVSSPGGPPLARAFPPWATLPSELDLGAGRRWHFFFAWILVANVAASFAWGLLYGGLVRRLIPTGGDLAHLPREILDHARLRFAKGEAARRYNGLQKLSYAAVVFFLVPMMALTGLAMSPMIDARLPFLVAALGGRQSARALHFLCASGLAGFVVIHLAMVILAGPANELRSMITGWFSIGRTERHT